MKETLQREKNEVAESENDRRLKVLHTFLSEGPLTHCKTLRVCVCELPTPTNRNAALSGCHGDDADRNAAVTAEHLDRLRGFLFTARSGFIRTEQNFPGPTHCCHHSRFALWDIY